MSLNTERIRAVCFDLDGTLRDTDDQYIERVAQLLKPFSAILPKADPLSTARRLVMGFESPVNALFDWADRLGLDGFLHRVLEVSNPWKKSSRNRAFTLVPGAGEALGLLAAHYPLAIVTSRGAGSTLAFLQYTKLEEYFRCVASALTSPRGKPRPDPILWAAQQMEIPPRECLMVGDTVVDIVAGKAAGAQTVGVLSGFGERHELEAQGAELILPSVAELPAALGIG